MRGLASAARGASYGHPLVVIGGLWVVCALCARRRAWPGTSAESGTRLASGLLWISAASYLGVVVWYIAVYPFFDHIEPSVLAISASLAHGGHIYPRGQERAYVGLPYGPLLFELHAGIIRAADGGVFAVKLISGAAAVGSLALAALAGRALAGQRQGTGLNTIGMMAALCLAFGPMTFWVRAEPLLLLATASAMVVGVSSWRWGPLFLAGATAAAFALKATALIAVLPAWVLFTREHGLRPRIVLLATVGFVATMIGIFAPADVSVQGYGWVLAETARQGVRWRSIAGQSEWAILMFLLAVPVATSRTTGRAMSRLGPAHAALLAALTVTVFIASKPGAGAYHFIPYIPVAIVLGRYEHVKSRAILAPRMVALVVAAAISQPLWIATVASDRSRARAAELVAFTGRYGHPYAVGYGRSSRASAVRAVPVLAGDPYVIDGPSIADRTLSGAAAPVYESSPLRRCAIPVWYIAKGERPFDTPNPYAPSRSLFPQDFQDGFGRDYVRMDSGEYFDVWVCRGSRSGRKGLTQTAPRGRP